MSVLLVKNLLLPALPSFRRARKYLWSSARLKQELKQGCRRSRIHTVRFLLAVQRTLIRGFCMQHGFPSKFKWGLSGYFEFSLRLQTCLNVSESGLNWRSGCICKGKVERKAYAHEATSFNPHWIDFLLEQLAFLQLFKCHVQKLCKMFTTNKNMQVSSWVSVTAAQERGNIILAGTWAALEQSQSHMLCFDCSYIGEIIAPGSFLCARVGRTCKWRCWQVRSRGDFSSDNTFYVLKYSNG